MKALKQVADCALIATTPRGEAEKSVDLILEFPNPDFWETKDLHLTFEDCGGIREEQ